MASFWGVLGNVALLSCLVPIILYFEHGRIPLPSLNDVYSFVFSTLPRRIYWIFKWIVFDILHRTWYLPSLFSKVAMDCKLGLCGWQMYLNYLFYELRLSTRIHTSLLLAFATFAFYTGIAVAVWS